MLKLLNKFKLLVIIPSIIAVIFVTLSIIPTNYDLTVPATLADIDDTYDFEGVDTSNVNVSSVSVYSFYNISVLNYLQSLINPYTVLDKHNEYVNTSIDYGYTSGTIQKKVSLNNSLIAGYNAANIELNAKFKGYIIHSIFGLEKSSAMLGDIIIKCEGVELTENLSISKVLADKYGTYEKDGLLYVNIEIDKEYLFTVRRGTEELDILVKAFGYLDEGEVFPSLGINYYEYYDVFKTGSEIPFKIVEPDSFGPSAGLMQALFIYDALSGENLTKDLHVVGTGTIDSKGNAGSIGGVKAKIMAAVLDKADVFFVPEENYEDALEQYNKCNTDMKLVSVSCLNDVISYLRNN